MESKKKKILEALKRHWHTNWELTVRFGPAALRRVRDLRKEGFPVRKERVIKDGKSTFTWKYRI